MTSASASNLSRAHIHRLLQAVGSVPAETEPDIETTDYNWLDPHYFDEDQRNRLAAVMTQVAALLSDRFAHFYKKEFDVKAASITQHFAADLADQIDVNQGFSLSFGPDPDQSYGFLIIGAKAALSWATRLLGDSEANDDPNRVISSLEESLLSDLMTAIVEAFLGPIGADQNLHPSATLFKGCPAMPCELTEEVCRIVFQVQQAEAEEIDEVSFVLPCHLLAPVVGRPLLTEAQPSQEQLTQVLMEHVQQMPVTVTAHLATTRLSFEEVLDLRADDILLIDKPLEEPLDVIVDGRTVFRGRPARSNGQYAIFVTESTTERVRQTATPSAAN